MQKMRKTYIGKPKKKGNRFLKLSLLAIFAILITTLIIFLVFKDKDKTPDSNPEDSSLKHSSSDKNFSENSLPSDHNSERSSGQISASVDSSFSDPLSSDPVFQLADREGAFDNLREQLTLYADSFDGRIAISYINLVGDENFHLGEKQAFVAASSIKMALVTRLFEEVRDGSISLTQEMKYDSRPYPQGDYEAGSGVIAGQPNGTAFSVQRVAQLTITVSDNCATNMVIRALGGIDQIVPHLYELSAVVPYREQVTYTNHLGQVLQGKHRISSRDLAVYAENLYRLWEADKDNFDLLMTDLKNTIFNFGLHADLPPGVEVAHKIGTNNAYTAENDVGIIFASEPFVLCVMTDTPSQERGRRALAEVSRIIYDYIESLHENPGAG